MKLLFFINSMEGGGAQRVMSVITSELAERGHDVTISLNSNECSYTINPLVKVVAASNRFDNKKRNIFFKIGNYFKSINCCRRHTKNIIRSTNPDVIITFLFCNMYSIARYHGQIPIIHSEHNAYDRKNGLEQYIKRFFLNKLFDKVFVLTPFDYGYGCAKGLKNTFVMPNPNTFKSITEEEYDNLFPCRKNILVCGRINQWHVKGIDLAIQAFSFIASQFPSVDLDIAGEGSVEALEELRQIAEKFGVQNRIHFLGKRDDIDSVMKNHQLFLLSSRTEGFPMVVTEAMSQGTPCVSFEKLSCSIIVDGIDGVLVNDGNLKELSKAMQDFLENSNLRYRMGRTAIKNIDRFTVRRIGDRWVDVLSDLKIMKS